MNAATAIREPAAIEDRPIILLGIDEIQPAPENERLYRPVDPSDPELRALAASIQQNGIQEPLIVSSDGMIISGHRRHAAARAAGLTRVPCRVRSLSWSEDPAGFIRLLRECNRQRVKDYCEKLREEIVSADPEIAYSALVAARAEAAAGIEVEAIELRAPRARCKLSAAKDPFLAAVGAILAERRAFWPLSDRQIHYALLNNPPLMHAGKPESRYVNTHASYKSLIDLLTRARLAGLIPMSCIDDPTRPVFIGCVHRDVQGYLSEELRTFLRSYRRDLMQSQPAHVEIVAEKLTVASIVRPVALRFCIPAVIGRGYPSLDARWKIVQRFRASGKARLVLLILSDFDPDGEEIAHSIGRSLRDDFDVCAVAAVKVALTADQVAEFALPPVMKAKATSVHYERFTSRHGEDVFELEALAPAALQRLLTEAIDKVTDAAAFNRELAAEKADAGRLEGTRKCVLSALKAA